MIHAALSAFTMSDGTVIKPPAAGVTLFVGPNNAGKSQALRDLLGLVGQPRDYAGRAVVSVELDKRGSAEEFREWVLGNVPKTHNSQGQALYPIDKFGPIPEAQLASAWNHELLQYIAALFVFHADAVSRLGAASSVASINFAQDPIVHPLQRAYVDPELERKLQEACQGAFGSKVVVDRYGGNVIALRVGTPPEFKHNEGAPSVEYIDAMRQLPLLEHQGDGMRSYMGLLLHVLGGSHKITLIDEPEAFLHPPQANLLGQTLAQRTTDSQQLFLATHSIDVLQGALEGSAQVTLVRVTRDGDLNRATVLNHQDVRSLWGDPLLRYSRLLDGLFHDAVVLCESDADCRYYESVFDSLYRNTRSDSNNTRRPQILFSHCGGKSRMASVTASLRAIGIPVVVVADFDILNDGSLMERTVTALGADPSPMRADLNVLSAALESDTKPLTKAAMREAFHRSLDGIAGELLTKKDATSLRGVIKIESGWDKIKRSGLTAVPQGAAYESCTKLLSQLKTIGLLVVPVGELERFVPSVAGHGPAWVTEVHERGLHDDENNKPPRDFVRDMIKATDQSLT